MNACWGNVHAGSRSQGAGTPARVAGCGETSRFRHRRRPGLLGAAGLLGAVMVALALGMALVAAPSGAQGPPGATDLSKEWPMWQYDAARSAAPPFDLPKDLHLQWVRELPEPRRAWPWQVDEQPGHRPKQRFWVGATAEVPRRGLLDFDVSYSPVAAGGRVFVPSNVTDSVTAYCIEDGNELWRYYADGPVRLAPAVWRGRVYFTSDDGRLYCVDAASGRLHWKFRGGPPAHYLLGNERIINYWAARGGPVVSDGAVYFAAGVWPLHGVFIYALDAETGAVEWVNDTTSSAWWGWGSLGQLVPQGYIAVGGDVLIVSGGRGSAGHFDRRTGEFLKLEGHGYGVHAGGSGIRRNEMLRERVEALSEQIEGKVFDKLAAHDRLVVSTEDGTLYCFGPRKAEPVRHPYEPAPLRARAADWAAVAEGLLEQLGERRGYALMLGAGSGDLLREVLTRSELHLTVVEPDAEVVLQLRRELSEAGMYGRRAAVIEAEPAEFKVQPYLFSMVVSEDAAAAGVGASGPALEYLLDRLRPYGGVAWLAAPAAALPELAEAAAVAAVDRVTTEAREDHLFARRDGPLTGADQWTHENRSAAASSCSEPVLVSQDERVRAPLGILWYGGPSNCNIGRRHAMGPRPQVAGGRQVFLGPETVSARCVYTGRALWERTFPELGLVYDSLRFDAGTIFPGVYRFGSPFVTLPDSVYVRYEERVFHLDAATGQTKAVFPLPGRPVREIYDENTEDWGHISVEGDSLIVTAEPYIFGSDDVNPNRRDNARVVGGRASHSGTTSRVLAVMDRHSGELLWQRRASIGFRHDSIISFEGKVRVIDGASQDVRARLARRDEEPEEEDAELLLHLGDGSKSEMAVADWMKKRPLTVERLLEDYAKKYGMEIATSRWDDRVGEDALPGTRVHRKLGKGCGPFAFSKYLITLRSATAAYYDLEHGSGEATISAVRAGCSNAFIAADGVLNGLDLTRTCDCTFLLQTSLALVHMPNDDNIEFWTRRNAAPRNPAGFGLNFGAPARRVDVAGSRLVWYNERGTRRRHPSAIEDAGASLTWVAASVWEPEGEAALKIEDLVHDAAYNVRLHFADLQKDIRPGDRVFDVFLNGQRVLERFDIAREAGGAFRAVVCEFSVKAIRGSMTLELRPSERAKLGPAISGIELVLDNARQPHAGAR